MRSSLSLSLSLSMSICNLRTRFGYILYKYNNIYIYIYILIIFIFLSTPVSSRIEIDESYEVKNVAAMETKIKEDLDRIAWTSLKLKEKDNINTNNDWSDDTNKKLDYLTADITEIQDDIKSLLTKLNTTNEELTKAEEKIDETEQGERI